MHGEQQSLSSLLNSMVARLEYTRPEEFDSVPEESHWALISLYMKIDPVLASLYKQYCEAKENIGKLLAKRDAHAPMAEIAWDMHDSLRSAVETRLIELKDDKAASGKVAAMVACHNATQMTRQKFQKPSQKPTQTMGDIMTFMLWAGMIMKDAIPNCDVRRDFCKAS